MGEELELRTAPGFVPRELRSEFPGLALDWVTVPGRRCASPLQVKRRLRELSNRSRGESVVAMRTQSIPHAYRAFYHQIGLDPDLSRIPSEEAAVARLLHGGFRSRNLVDDALMIGLIETGVPVWALDADLLDVAGLGIRATVAGDRLGSTELGDYLAPGRLAVADARCIHALLFGELAPGHGVGSSTERVALFAVSVAGVPAIHVEEALWVCLEVLRAA